MSKEDLTRLKLANTKLLALQRKKALLDKMAVDLDDDQAVVAVVALQQRPLQDLFQWMVVVTADAQVEIAVAQPHPPLPQRHCRYPTLYKQRHCFQLLHECVQKHCLMPGQAVVHIHSVA